MSYRVDKIVPENLSEEHLRALYEVSTWINSTLDFDSALDNTIKAIIQVTKAERGYIMSLDENTNKVRVLAAQDSEGNTVKPEGYSTSITTHVIDTMAPLLTNNAQFDNSFNAGQSIIIQGLRAIMAAPMLVHKSEADKPKLVGVVYVDTSMKTAIFRPDDLSLMQAVSGLAARAIENARLYLLAAEKGRLEHELQMAHDIQRNLLPRDLPMLKGYDLAAHWESAREVAGDFWDAFQLDKNTIGTVVADVSDKGAPAALFMAVARTLIRSHAHAGMPAVETVGRTNDLLCIDADQSGMFVTLFYSQFERNGNSVHVNGGHNPPAVYHAASGEVDFMPIGGRALGWFPDNPVEEITLHLERGDCIVYYTDGLTEAENPQKEPYGEDRLAAYIARTAKKSALEIKNGILHDLEVFCAGEAPFDDITMMVVKYTG
jgi:serine phosphatase RsbU (regulator of sigma subunit)